MRQRCLSRGRLHSRVGQIWRAACARRPVCSFSLLQAKWRQRCNGTATKKAQKWLGQGGWREMWWSIPLRVVARVGVDVHSASHQQRLNHRRRGGEAHRAWAHGRSHHRTRARANGRRQVRRAHSILEGVSHTCLPLRLLAIRSQLRLRHGLQLLAQRLVQPVARHTKVALVQVLSCRSLLYTRLCQKYTRSITCLSSQNAFFNYWMNEWMNE